MADRTKKTRVTLPGSLADLVRDLQDGGNANGKSNQEQTPTESSEKEESTQEPMNAETATTQQSGNEDRGAQDSGYQLAQSFYALGSGGFFGVGMGASTQKMFYLPEAHNDFIMAVLGEELGFLGISVVMLLFALMFARCYRIVLGQKELRDRMTAFALSLILALGAVLNLAVVMGMAPPKGVAMPFLSYGGSSLLCSLICVGLLLNYSRTAERE